MRKEKRPVIPKEAIIEVNNSKKLDFSKPVKLIYFEWWFYLLTAPFYGLCLFLVGICSIYFSLRVKNRKAVRKVMRTQGCITVSNHCHYFDTVFANYLIFPQRLYVSVAQRNFEVPYVRRILRFLRSFPIPSYYNGEKLDSLALLREPVGEALKRGYHVHFLPEGDLVHLSQTIHQLKRGAFYLAYQHQAPVVPMVYVLKRRKFFGKELGPNWITMTCHFGEAVYPPALKGDGKDITQEELYAMSDAVASWMEATLAEAHNR